MRLRAAIVALCLALPGCSSHLTSAVMPGADVRGLKTAYVVCRPEEDANICQMLAENLQAHGFTAQTGTGPPPADVQVVVTYEDRWTWDMATYLLTLRVDMRDPHTNVLLATAQVFATSLVRRSPARMARESIDAMLGGNRGGLMYVDLLAQSGGTQYGCLIDFRVTLADGTVRGLQAREKSADYEQACDAALANVTVATLNDPDVQRYITAPAAGGP